MGINMFILSPGWDSCANGGMKKILGDIDKFPRITISVQDLDDSGSSDEFRPADFDLWRKSIRELDCNVNMWLTALDTLEADPDATISYSY